MNSRPQIAYVQFPGSNTETETVATIERNHMVAVPHFWNESFEKLKNYDGYIILGGFSYEDRSRSGIIASLEPIMDQLKKEVGMGKPLLGICNGAQILVESGIVPGNKKFDTIVGLTENKRIKNNQIVGTGYYNRWCHIKANQKSVSAFIEKDGAPLCVPIAHAEGRFVMEKEILGLVKEKSLINYRYCTAEGKIDNNFPTNPNGSIENIAALGNAAGNVMAIMPHPERTINGEGDSIFRAMYSFLKKEEVFSYKALKYSAKKIKVFPFKKQPLTKELLISMVIADNEASSVEKCVQNLGGKTKVKKYLHFEIEVDGDLDLKEVYKTDVLFNPNKEFVASPEKQENIKRFLVREKENIDGRKIKDVLQKRFGFKEIKSVQKGIVWEISSEKAQLKKDVDLILNSHILFNPISQVCNEY